MKFLWILIICCFSINCIAQTDIGSSNKEAQKIFEQANQYLTLKQYEKAIEKLESAISHDKNFLAAYQQLGDINRKLQRYQLAKSNYLKIFEINPNFHSLTIFGLAESEFLTGDYSSALIHFKQYAALPNLSSQSKTLTLKYIADCEFSIATIQKPVLFHPKNLGPFVNTTADEYLPVVTADEEILIFTRRSNNNEDFFQSIKKNNQWFSSTSLSSNINTVKFNEGSQCISPDGMYLFFTGCNRPEGIGRCDIYVCRREGKDWSKPFNIGPPVNTPGWESQPSISADGRTLYFVSSRSGGLGGTDIWQTTLLPEGSWSQPKNLGPTINTPYDEISPFIHPDGQTLYFASNGWPGFGKNDIYFSRKDDSGSWNKPLNLGFPINNYGEQSGLTISTDGVTAYIGSDQTGGIGNMDIYSFELPVESRPQKVAYVKGRVYDSITKEPVDADIKITELNTDYLMYEDKNDSNTGSFLATMPIGKKYALSIDKPGYLFYSLNFSLDKKDITTTFQIEVPLQKISVGSLVTLNNIFFETNKSELLEYSKTELEHLINFLKSNANIIIEIEGHTDNIGDESKNLLLSKERAKSVYNYLLSKKIPANRISYKGFGESAPIAPNTSEEGRQKNRRTEFKVVKI